MGVAFVLHLSSGSDPRDQDESDSHDQDENSAALMEMRLKVADMALNASEIMYAFFVIDPLCTWMGEFRTRAFLGLSADSKLLGLGNKEDTDIFFTECLFFCFVFVWGLGPLYVPFIAA